MSSNLFDYILDVLPKDNNNTVKWTIGRCCMCGNECNPASQSCGICARNPPIHIIENMMENWRTQ
jgi:hypothetical protein